MTATFKHKIKPANACRPPCQVEFAFPSVVFSSPLRLLTHISTSLKPCKTSPSFCHPVLFYERFFFKKRKCPRGIFGFNT